LIERIFGLKRVYAIETILWLALRAPFSKRTRFPEEGFFGSAGILRTARAYLGLH
jgi:hypothetical protein